MDFHLEKIENVISNLETSINGLSSAEANSRLKKFGKNEFEKAKPTLLILRFIQQILDPMIIILLVAAAVSAFVSVASNESFADVIIILAVVIINAVLGVYQESKAEKSIEALQKMSAAKSVVFRDGKKIVIDSANIVVGDVVLLQAGDAVPADGRIIESVALKIEESALTGESIANDKIIDALYLEKGKNQIDLADRTNMAYMGSTVVYGRGAMVVTQTGMNTEMGKIAGALQNVSKNKTPLQIKMHQLSKVLTWLVIGICLVVFALQLIGSNGFTVEFILNSFMVAICLAVAAIPEGLPAVVTVALSIGVSKMSKRNAIIRKLTAVETLGCAQIICSDKTGTLTQNKMTVVDSYSSDENFLSLAMGLCCDASIENGEVQGEPTEAALVTWADKHNFNLNDYSRIDEIPFDSARKMMSTLHNYDSKYLQCSKGAPDVILTRCDKIFKDGKISNLDDFTRNKILQQNKSMADKALRVLACAIQYYDNKPDKLDVDNNETGLVFLGLVGMIDPVRPEVVDSIEICENAGITPIMITGDHINTACAIARDLNILNDDKSAITGSELDNLSDEEFKKCFRNISVYARVRPEHKSRIVKTWQDAGYVVAMTGDGVNDAPSIKTADIGVGMGITGTDVTKNVADMVLADDNFATIVNAVEEGRRIYENILKCIQYLLGSNIGEVLCVFFASLFGFVILLPVHLLLVNMVTDCIPALALGLEEKEPGIMKKAPRDKNDGIFSNGLGFDTIYQGIIITVLIILSYVFGVYFESGHFAFVASDEGMTMAFLTTSMVGCFQALNMRSRRQSIFKLNTNNWLLYASVIFSLLLLAIICFVPAIAQVFSVVQIGFLHWLIAIALALAIIPIVEIIKFFQRKFAKK